MKGISLSIETIVVIVLAVIVLTALLAFFLGIWNPNANEAQLQADKTRLCGRYSSLYPDCDNIGTDSEDLRRNISSVCSRLGFSSCFGGSPASISCIEQCCYIYCSSP